MFGSDFLKKLEYLSLVSRRAFRGQILARRRTKQLGGGVEFADHREYTPGDDFRYLDWNVFARHDELLLRRFQEEEDLHVYILLDVSRSMGFGDPQKLTYACQVAAAVAYVALSELDRVAVLAFADDLFVEYPLTRGKDRILSLLSFLEGLETQSADTHLHRAFRTFVHRPWRRGVAVVISDFFDSHGFDSGLDLLRHHRFEPHVIQIIDPKEANPSLRGDVELVDMETSKNRRVTITEKNLRDYREAFTEFQKGIDRYCLARGLGWTRTSTDVPFDTLVLNMMRTSGIVQ